MTTRWFYQHGSFVVSCRDLLDISTQNHPLHFSENSGLKWEGNFPEPVNLSIHQRIDIKTSLGYPFTTGTLCMSFYDTLHFEGNMREISMWKYPRWFSREKRGKYPHRKLSFISPEFPQGNYEEISTGMIPWNSPTNPCGNLGDVDGLPAGFSI